MEWGSLKGATDQEILSFLKRWEWKNVALSRHYRELREGTLGWMRKSSSFHLGKYPQKEDPAGLVYAKGGLLLPLTGEGVSPRELASPNIPWSMESPRTILGEACLVSTLEPMVRRPMRASVNYDLMARIGQPVGLPCPMGDLQIVKAKPAQAEQLFPLQKAYEFEEVLLDSSFFSDEVCRQNLKETLKRENVLVALHRGIPVAKAGTNARGYSFSQVGGVYTLPRYRNRGIARYLMSHLAEMEWKQGRGLALFVKKTNFPARVLYGEGGYKKVGDFRISYW